MGKPQGGLLEADDGSMAATVVVGLIGALVAEAAGSITGRQLYRNRCVPQEADKPLGPKPDFGSPCRNLSLDTFNDAGP